MSVDLHWEYYPKECNNKKILPFLNYDICARWMSGKSVPKGFYQACNDLGTWDENNSCWIFDDIEKLYEFAAKEEVPAVISDYITLCEYLQDAEIEHRADDIFVIWKR